MRSRCHNAFSSNVLLVVAVIIGKRWGRRRRFGGRFGWRGRRRDGGTCRWLRTGRGGGRDGLAEIVMHAGLEGADLVIAAYLPNSVASFVTIVESVLLELASVDWEVERNT